MAFRAIGKDQHEEMRYVPHDKFATAHPKMFSYARVFLRVCKEESKEFVQIL